MSHGEVYVAQVSTAHVSHFYRAVMDANEYPGPAVLIAYTPCMPEHGIADDAGARSLRAAVDSRAFPLFTYDPRRGETIAERLSLAGNPSVDDDWRRLPDGTEYDFVAFARDEGRFAPHFAADGTPTPEMIATRDDRLANWRTLKELAGVGRDSTARSPMALEFAETNRTMTAEEAQAAAATVPAMQGPDMRRSLPDPGRHSRAISSTLPSATSPLQPRCSLSTTQCRPSRAACASTRSSARARASGRRPRVLFRLARSSASSRSGRATIGRP